jgi:hypothetical protein
MSDGLLCWNGLLVGEEGSLCLLLSPTFRYGKCTVKCFTPLLLLAARNRKLLERHVIITSSFLARVQIPNGLPVCWAAAAAAADAELDAANAMPRR